MSSTLPKLLLLPLVLFPLLLYVAPRGGAPLLSSPLPAHSGRHGVGAVDVEVAVPGAPRVLSETRFKREGRRAFELETVLFSLYYPAAADRGGCPGGGHRWLSAPVGLLADGYARFAGVRWVPGAREGIAAGLWALAGGTRVEARVEAGIWEGEGAEGGSGEDAQRVFMGAAARAEDGGKLPVVVFSHGMASSRTSYSQYCGELASRGYVVAAIEHRDGSGPGSVVMGPEGTRREVVHFSAGDLESGDGELLSAARLKEEQLAFRQAEVEETIAVLRRINEGSGQEIYEQNARGEGRDLRNWKGRLDFDRLVVGGHSYGATLALQTLKGAPNDKIPARGAIVLDPGKSSGPLNDDISVPVLVVHSNSWSKRVSVFFGRPHFDVVKELVSKTLRGTGASWFLTSVGTTHPSVTDAPLIEPTLLSWTTGASIDAKEGLRQYVKVSTEFLSFLTTGRKEGVLSQGVTHDLYGEENEGIEGNVPEEVSRYWEVHVAPEDGPKDS